MSGEALEENVMMYLGIDPGASGGIATITYEKGGVKVRAVGMPKTERDLWELLSGYSASGLEPGEYNIYAVLEKVGGVVSYTGNRPGMGHSMFQFGKSFGLCYMALIAAGIPFDLVAPQTWQKEFSAKRNKGEIHSQWKGRLKGIAQRMFPGLKVTLETADALLLCEYARRSQRLGVG